MSCAAIATKCDRFAQSCRGLLAHQADEGLVDERRRLQGVAGPLAPQVRRREPVQLVFDDLGDLAERGLVAAPPVLQQDRHRSGLGTVHARPGRQL